MAPIPVPVALSEKEAAALHEAARLRNVSASTLLYALVATGTKGFTHFDDIPIEDFVKPFTGEMPRRRRRSKKAA